MFEGCSSLVLGVVGKIEWSLNKETNELIFTGEGSMSLPAHPWTASKELIKLVNIYEGITSIGEGAFSDCSSLNSVSIADSVTEIGENAFSGCSSLSSIVIPDSVTTIGKSAFSGCRSLTSITIPNSVTTIGERAFCGCSSLKSTIIPDRITTIGEGAFSYCSSLKSIIILNSVTTIGEGAFSECSSLLSVSILSNMKVFKPTIIDECTRLTSGKLGDISWKMNENKTELLFTGKGRMPEFYKRCTPWENSCSNIKTIRIEEGIISVGDYAFSSCKKLKKVYLPSTIESVGFKANLKGAKIGPNIERTVACGNNCFGRFCDGIFTIEGTGKLNYKRDYHKKSTYYIDPTTASWASIKKKN